MNRTPHRSRLAGAAAFAASFSIAVLAQAPAIDLKLGLWETTTVASVDMGGTPPMDTSKMTPQQKAKMEEAMKIAGSQHTDTQRRCITKDDIGKSFFPSAQEGCTDAITANTRSVLDITRTCRGTRAETSQVHMEALSRESIKGTVASTTTQGDRNQKMHILFTSKWVAADCGTAKR
jgi:hypothetical protein